MKFGLVGANIESSLSPDIHSSFLSECELEGVYRLIPADEDSILNVLMQCYDNGYDGLNITAPFKIDAAFYCQ